MQNNLMKYKNILLFYFLLPIYCLGQNDNNIFSNEIDINSVNWITLPQAEYLLKEENKYILLFFYREGCEFCEKMKTQTFKDLEVLNLINHNFLPVMINGKGKKPILYNDSIYVNEKSNESDPPFFHNFFKHLVDLRNENYYWPTIVIIDKNYNKIIQGSGFWPRELAIRNFKYLLAKEK
ncbi:MAG: hypothetical protein CMD06_01300 [Flavobacteriales bacterium]|nr:hypothetical protein [Flavobacteriales bacterium]